MGKSTILVIDDEPNIRKLLADILSDEGFGVLTAEDGSEGLKLLTGNVVDCALLDVWLPGLGGVEVLESIRQIQPDLPVIMISGHASVDVAVRAVKLGAFDFLEKPLSVDRTLTQVRNALELDRLKQENRHLRRKLTHGDDFIGNGPAMQEVRRLIRQAAKSDAGVFITGENGTGKELVAREIHNLSGRAGKAFVAVNCAAIPDNLIESELFGHEKGAFTGALAQKPGRFELADKGTLFLDEIVDLSTAAQAKVLRAVQEQRFERVGGLASVQVNLRFIAASNKDIHQAMQNHLFREDLFYRLHVLPIHMPPLRQRVEDIPELVAYFLREAVAVNSSLSIPRLDQSAMDSLAAYGWPGNVRQLKNIVQRLLVLAVDPVIDAALVETALAADNPAGKSHDAAAACSEWVGLVDLSFNDAKDEFERQFILQKLKENQYNISRTAQALSMYPSNLHAKIRKFNITIDK
jgi:two-component system nitrogen regulation response regulator NtrX